MPVTEDCRTDRAKRGSGSHRKTGAGRRGDDMRQAGLVKVRAGITSLEEILRVTDN